MEATVNEVDVFYLILGMVWGPLAAIVLPGVLYIVKDVNKRIDSIEAHFNTRLDDLRADFAKGISEHGKINERLEKVEKRLSDLSA